MPVGMRRKLRKSGAGEESRAICNFKDAGRYELKYYTHCPVQNRWYLRASDRCEPRENFLRNGKFKSVNK